MLEIVVCRALRKDYISFSESVANFGTQIGNQTVNVLMAVGVYVSYGWLYENYRIFTIQLNWFTFILLFLGIDFIFYWVHRWGHEINIFWAAHSPHHSAEEMNFIVSLRTGITQRLLYFMFFWVMTIVGFHPVDIYLIVGIHVAVGFIYHTEFVGKLWRPIEFIFTTPSHHRVHHGVNLQYLDKNYGEFLIIWDRIFGTFEEEDEKPAYGMLDHPMTTNPILINFHFYIVLWKYAVAAPFWQDKIRVWFMPAGWVPRGLERKEKPNITVENQVKFRPKMFPNAKIYLTLQVLLGIAWMLGVISNVYDWSTGEKWIGAAILWWQIVNWSGILESKPWLDTGIDVQQGCIVILDPRGRVDVSAGWGVHDAHGTEKYYPNFNYPVNSNFRYGLAAQITPNLTARDRNRDAWIYEYEGTHTAKRSGRLWLVVNDDNPQDNSGEFRVRVRISCNN